jgi:hypothetical protein
MSNQIVDHKGQPVAHGRAKVNDVRLHYVIGGSGDPPVPLARFRAGVRLSQSNVNTNQKPWLCCMLL